jgi:hypothetical protein
MITPVSAGSKTITLTIGTNVSITPTEVSVVTNATGFYEYELYTTYPLTYTVEASFGVAGANSPVLVFSTYWDETEHMPEHEREWWERLGESIPGFPFESIIIGFLLSLGLLIYLAKKKSAGTLLAPK